MIKNIEDIKVPETTFEDKLLEYNSLKEYALHLKNLKEEIKRKKIKLEEVNKLVQEEEEALKGFKVCPLCHKPLD